LTLPFSCPTSIPLPIWRHVISGVRMASPKRRTLCVGERGRLCHKLITSMCIFSSTGVCVGNTDVDVFYFSTSEVHLKLCATPGTCGSVIRMTRQFVAPLMHSLGHQRDRRYFDLKCVKKVSSIYLNISSQRQIDTPDHILNRSDRIRPHQYPLRSRQVRFGNC